jgi:hypothetical protein
MRPATQLASALVATAFVPSFALAGTSRQFDGTQVPQTCHSPDALSRTQRDTSRVPTFEVFRGSRQVGRLFYAMHGQEGAPDDADVIDFFDGFDVRGRAAIERLWAESADLDATFELGKQANGSLTPAALRRGTDETWFRYFTLRLGAAGYTLDASENRSA